MEVAKWKCPGLEPRPRDGMQEDAAEGHTGLLEWITYGTVVPRHFRFTMGCGRILAVSLGIAYRTHDVSPSPGGGDE